MKKIITLLLIQICLTSVVEAKTTAGPLQPVASFWGPRIKWRLGYFLSQAGDVNGDGFGDFMIGAYHDCTYGFNAGVVYLFYGKSTLDWGEDCPVTDADHIFYGRQEYDLLGFNFSGGGDVNGDGYSDILIGAPGNWEGKPYTGEAFVLLGGENPGWSKRVRPYYDANASFVGEDDYEQLGYVVGFAGDVNSDGFDDFLIGVPYKNTNNVKWSGKAYLILGSADGWTDLHLPVQDRAVASFIYSGEEALTGFCVNGIGDVDDDGYDDFAISSPGSGLIFALFGNANAAWGYDFDLATADIKFIAEMENDDAGNRVCCAGDVNGDGIDDFLISSTRFIYKTGGWEAGKTWMFLGRTNWSENEISLTNAEASYLAEGPKNHAGFGLSAAGDVDVDGYDDFLIGARWYSGLDWNAGKAYLIKGKPDGWEPNTELKSVNLFFRGEREQSCVGWGVTTTGDVNGDGISDYLISAPFDREAGVCAGQVYLFTGKANHSECVVRGTVRHFATDVPLTDVTMQLTGASEQTVNVDDRGYYELHLPISRNYRVKPFRAVDPGLDNPAITAHDAWLAARIAVNLVSADSLQFRCADVNRDQRISAFDASLILKHVVGKADVCHWFFEPENTRYAPALYPEVNQNYQAWLAGDVNGSRPVADSSSVQKTPVALLSADQSSPNDLRCSLQLDHERDIYSFDARIDFDPSAVRFKGIDNLQSDTDFQLEYNVMDGNRLLISGYALNGMSPQNNRLTLIFDRITEDEQQQLIQLNTLFINDSTVNYHPVSSSVNRIDETPQTFKLYPNYPNPFNPGTVISYYLQQSSYVRITIRNLLGQVIRECKPGKQAAGDHRLHWDGKDATGHVLPSGIYLYTITAGHFQQTRKMVKL